MAVEWRTQYKLLLALVGGFALVYVLPVGWPRFDHALLEGLHLARWYAREHVLLCLVPAFYIAGAISVFVSQAAVLRYLGPAAPRPVAYGVASVAGTVLAVCSCTVLPLFAGITRLGAGLGPAITFLYAGPAISVLAIVLTARVLGLDLGIARTVAAVGFSVVIGLAMQWLYRREEQAKAAAQADQPPAPASHPLWQNAVVLGAMVGVLVFANWSAAEGAGGPWRAVAAIKWPLAAACAALLGLALSRWFGLAWWKLAVVAGPTAVLALALPDWPQIAFTVGALGLGLVTATSDGLLGDWFAASWEFAKLILPLLLIGVVVAGLLLGRPGEEGLIPSAWVASAVGGNSLQANLLAAVAGAFMYFATLTEIPILHGLVGSGMGGGPALALLLAGPALSLPSMLVLVGVMGLQKTAVYVALVILTATLAGLAYGASFG